MDRSLACFAYYYTVLYYIYVKYGNDNITAYDLFYLLDFVNITQICIRNRISYSLIYKFSTIFC